MKSEEKQKVERYDKHKMWLALDKFPLQCREAANMAKKVKIKFRPENIIICGMGGSGIGAKLIKNFEQDIEVIPHLDYDLPKKASENSLVIIISYSGNTEETLSAYNKAVQIGAKVISITSGGRLSKLNKNSIIVKSGYCPRNVAGYLFLLPLLILSNNGLVEVNFSLEKMLEALDKEKIKALARKHAEYLKGLIPVIYSSSRLDDVAYSFKTHVNENAKQPAFVNVFPEMNHNEIEGYKKLAGGFCAVFIEDKDDEDRIKKRIKTTKKVIEREAHTLSIEVKGDSMLNKMLYLIYLTDYLSYFLALENKVDPTLTPLIDELKKKM